MGYISAGVYQIVHFVRIMRFRLAKAEQKKEMKRVLKEKRVDKGDGERGEQCMGATARGVSACRFPSSCNPSLHQLV